MFNSRPKYVASTTMTSPSWAGTTVLSEKLPAAVEALKSQAEGDVVVVGSAGLAHTLVREDLVDVYRPMIHPVVLESGKRLFPTRAETVRLHLVDSATSEQGLVLLTCRRAARASGQLSLAGRSD
jgi:dihydrofolate reductase